MTAATPAKGMRGREERTLTLVDEAEAAAAAAAAAERVRVSARSEL
jgi:hypothetical protein